MADKKARLGVAQQRLHEFTIDFGSGMCGLEINFDENTKTFTVGSVFEKTNEVAKRYRAILEKSTIMALNGKPTTNLASMDAIQEMFKAVSDQNKLVTFQTNFVKTADKNVEGDAIRKEGMLMNFYLEGDRKIEKISGEKYLCSLARRPLGFTIYESPGKKEVQVCQVDSVHEQTVLLGSTLLSVNGTPVKDLKSGIDLLLEGRVPMQLMLAENYTIFENDTEEVKREDDDNAAPTRILQSLGNKEDQITIEVSFLSEPYKTQHGVFDITVNKYSSIAVIRAQIALLCGLKYQALRLIAVGKRLQNDQAQIKDVWGDKKSYKLVVVVSEKELAKAASAAKDYRAKMRMMGAFLKTVPPATYKYFWDDIDHEKKGLLHITELDRLLARVIGVYERAMSITPNPEYEFCTVDFETHKNLGLVIEGNEVIMCHEKSQADSQGILAGYKVVGTEYMSKDTKKRMKLTVDHLTCLQSLKRAKTECTDDGFKVLCQKPVGERYELQIVMKQQAIADLKLNDGSQTLKVSHYEKLPKVWAPEAYRVEQSAKPTKAGTHGIELTGDTGEGKTGAWVKDVDAAAWKGVKLADRLIGVGTEDVSNYNVAQCVKLIETYNSPPILTFDRGEDYKDGLVPKPEKSN